MTKQHSVLITRNIITTKGLKPKHEGEHEVFNRHSIISGWKQCKILSAKIGIIGAGGLGGRFAINLARIGIGNLILCDSDDIELSNLSRQPFYEHQIEHNKALTLQDNLRAECTESTTIEAYPLDFQEVIIEYPKAFSNIDLLVCLVDNDKTRYDASEYALKNKMPILFSAVSRDTRSGYVFIQDKDGPCFQCIYPNQDQESQNNQCKEPGVIYIHTAIVGIGVYATVSKLQNWKLPWNFFNLSLVSESIVTLREKRKNCTACGG